MPPNGIWIRFVSLTSFPQNLVSRSTVCVWGGAVIGWQLMFILGRGGGLELILFGTGSTFAPLPAHVRKHFHDMGVQVDIMNTVSTGEWVFCQSMLTL